MNKIMMNEETFNQYKDTIVQTCLSQIINYNPTTTSIQLIQHNIWALKIIQKAYSYSIPPIQQWLQDILQSFISSFLLQFDFTSHPKIKAQSTKIIARILITLLSSQSHIHLLQFILLQIHHFIKSDLSIIYDILYYALDQSLLLFNPIAPLLALSTIKKLTSSLVSQQASKLFGYLVPLLTLQSPFNIQQFTDQKLIKKIHKANQFHIGFGKMTKVHYQISAGLLDQSILRDYQWQGIRWLAFLVKYNLNAALCDDMGLGKTLQTLTVIANETAKHQNQQLVSLVVAPNTVVDHWNAEIKKYIDPKVLKPQILQANIDKNDSNIWLVSYTQLLKLAPLINKQEFFFLVLDEAHILKNNKNKSSKLIKTIKAKHKIVLSGTPVQNHLLELWALFDILFSNYLGDEEYFKKHFSKAFHTNLFSLTDDELLFDHQQTQTLKQLHKKVLPFIMRRTKQDVLPQLPPKIIEDYYCPLMPPLQTQLYQILDKNSFSSEFESKLLNTQGEQKNKVCESILKLLQLLRKVLDHPFLIKTNFQEQKKTKKKIKMEPNQDVNALVNQEINQIFASVPNPENYQHSGKMIALKDILQQLGFSSADDGPASGEQIQLFTNYNKVLIFSRFKQALQMIAEQVLKTQFPSLQYLILDGDVPQNQRYGLVTKFNEDPDVRILLLTTQVGGLGLNLSSANIVIMFDHDYNPVNDQQAMDRAHRLGQRNVVQVFRLIVKDTLEEKIMGIQRFKLAISKAIINSDNASLKQMEKTDLLSLLEASNSEQKQEGFLNDQRILLLDQSTNITGPYQKILSQLHLDLLEQMDFDKEY